ncbi:MAG: glycosyltransferase family 9 protein [Bacteroidetes bacterium]|nr:MAG: glycosyltransferase family 9 protein [Bacteroidota bacterium]REK00810.1 MAG: glycosyltransferase family 9 protein [Bacteroidota bacterium]REK35050.1 MAG: glycosyltransferase family 9 protein [Bacteroidota bacterium]REK48216.1 MAG: glycosyltransferase family 9 protein [Bacteroidota bacterium]
MPKFLIIRFSSIGDIVLTTPVVRCLKNQVPDAQVHFLTKKLFKDVLRANPYIDKMHLLDESINELVENLRKEKFDFIIDLHHNQRSQFVKFRLGVKSFSFNKINIEKWLMVNFKLNRLPDQHIVDRYLETLGDFKVSYDGDGLDYFTAPESDRIMSVLPKTHSEYVAFVIGAKHSTKRLPESKIVSIIRSSEKSFVLLGGHEDKGIGTRIAEQCGQRVYSACGTCSLDESAVLLKNASHVITHDTGLMHIATALGKKIVSVWGNTIPEFGMYPFYSESFGGKNAGMKTVVEVSGLSCRPCTKIGFEKCPKNHFNCMNQIDEKKILSALNS